MENDVLVHYGILGMKWGVRRSPEQLSRARGRTKSDNEHEDYKRSHTKKSTKTMSDAELRNRINRLQMERQYKQLTAKEISAGKKFVNDVLRESAKQVASKYVSKGITKLFDEAINAVKK